MCHNTPGRRGRANVDRAQDLDGAASMRRVCVTRHLVEEVEPKSIVLKTSTALRVNGACVSQDTLGLRGRASVDRAQDLDGAASMRRVCVTRHTGGAAIMQRMCVSQDTPGLSQHLDGAASMRRVCVARHACGAAIMQRMCVSQDTPGRRGGADVLRPQDLDGAASMRPVCVTRHTWSKR